MTLLCNFHFKSLIHRRIYSQPSPSPQLLLLVALPRPISLSFSSLLYRRIEKKNVQSFCSAVWVKHNNKVSGEERRLAFASSFFLPHVHQPDAAVALRKCKNDVLWFIEKHSLVFCCFVFLKCLLRTKSEDNNSAVMCPLSALPDVICDFKGSQSEKNDPNGQKQRGRTLFPQCSPTGKTLEPTQQCHSSNQRCRTDHRHTAVRTMQRIVCVGLTA